MLLQVLPLIKHWGLCTYTYIELYLPNSTAQTPCFKDLLQFTAVLIGVCEMGDSESMEASSYIYSYCCSTGR